MNLSTNDKKESNSSKSSAYYDDIVKSKKTIINKIKKKRASRSKSRERSPLLYAYLRQKDEGTPFKIHITIDRKNNLFRLYYNITFYKLQLENSDLFKDWTKLIKSLPIGSRKKDVVRKEKNTKSDTSIKKKGSCRFDHRLFKDVFGFYMGISSTYVKGELDCEVNFKNRIIDIIASVKISDVSDFVKQVEQLPYFSQDPDKETTISTVHFFNPSRVRNSSKVKTN